MKKKERNSNYELMRIISMFLIVIYHVICHSGILYSCTNPSIKIILNLIVFISIVHVNSFVLVSGYFQSGSSFKQSKLWSVINASLFYRSIIVFLLTTIGYISISKLDLIRELFPLDTVEYWFIKCYLLLYCLSPFLNKAIESFDKKTFQKLLLVLFIIFSMLPTISGGLIFINDGYSLYSFIFLYFLGAYLKKYPLKEMYIFKPFSKRLYQIVLITIFTTSFILNYIISNYVIAISGINSFFDEIIRCINTASIVYSNPLVIIQSVAYFAFFETLEFKNKIVNKIATTTIGVYLIHDNNYIRGLIPKIFKINPTNTFNYFFVIRIIGISLIIYIVCTVIELMRQLIFKLIYKLKLSTKIRNTYYNFLKEINIQAKKQ